MYAYKFLSVSSRMEERIIRENEDKKTESIGFKEPEWMVILNRAIKKNPNLFKEEIVLEY